jgi:hypothetical protein
MTFRSSIRGLLLVAWTMPAAAQPAPPPAPDIPEDVEVEDEQEGEPEGEPDTADATIYLPTEPDPQVLADRLQELEAKLVMAEQSRKARFPVKISGFGDVGAFATQGDGTGWRRDAGHVMFPDRGDYAWVFYGDLLATTVNTRGDVADLGDSPGIDRFDSISSNGSPTFLVNELNVRVDAGLSSRALFTSSLNFTPRSGGNFRLGDAVDADLVQLEWMPTASGKHSLFVGKVDSVIGVEYKTRRAHQRFGITPSLLARYTTGTAVGIKGRSKLFDDHVVLAAAITNGSFGTEQFHFFSEIDSNSFKTLSGRASFRLPIGTGGTFEVGASGQYGTQDGTPDGAGAMWFYGAEAELELQRLAVKAAWMKGKAPGDEVTMTYSLDLKQGGYVETNFLLTSVIGLLARAEFRDAEVAESRERLYITKNWRATAGMRFTLSPNAVIKAEYLHNGSYGGVPNIPDDVVTTSAVLAF